MFSKQATLKVLTLSQLKALYDTLAADAFWKHSTKGNIAKNYQLVILPQSFQLFSVIIPSFSEIFHNLLKMFLKSSAADMLYVGKG